MFLKNNSELGGGVNKKNLRKFRKSKTMSSEEKIFKNLRRCAHFNKCSQNLCPLDLELPLRKGGEQDKCRWMRNHQKKIVNGQEFISGGKVMPDGILIFVPKRNLKWLNGVSQKRWWELKYNKK